MLRATSNVVGDIETWDATVDAVAGHAAEAISTGSVKDTRIVLTKATGDILEHPSVRLVGRYPAGTGNLATGSFVPVAGDQYISKYRYS